MAFWSGEKLAEMTDELFATTGKKLIDPFKVTNIDCNAYTLHMGSKYFLTADEARGGEEPKKMSLLPGEAFTIPAGQFAFLLTRERVSVPRNAMGFISMKTGVKFQGLVNVSGFHVDPGYEGGIIFAAYNASPSPVHLTEGTALALIWFAYLDRASSKIKAPGSGMNDISNELIRGMNKEVLSLQGMSERLRENEKRLNEKMSAIELKITEQKSTLDNVHFIWRALVIGVALSLVGLVVTSLIPIAWRGGQYLADSMGFREKENPPEGDKAKAIPPSTRLPDSKTPPTDDKKL